MLFPPLYPIIDTAVCRARGIAPLALAAACLRGGARVLQVRHKPAAADDGSQAFLELATELADRARAYGAMLIVNDRADIARLAGAGGVHVGQEDMPVDDVRRVLGTEATVGLSTHTEAQVDEALRTTATYVAVGPVFGTATKDTGYGPRGLGLVRYAGGRGTPIVAIGGVTLDNAASVIEAGASSVAVITDLLTGGDPEARVRAFRLALQDA